MKIIYPYNEILPLKKAHDAYVIRQCAALAKSGMDVTLLCGKGSLSRSELFSFYKIAQDNPLKIAYLPILRRNNFLRLNWNIVFFMASKRYIERHHPDVVIFSVPKQARYLLKKRVGYCKYVYEVHQLQWYPSMKGDMSLKKVRQERWMLNSCDYVTTTTHSLKKILQTYPYHLNPPIEVIPLACDFDPLPKKTLGNIFHLFYVGQLYEKQGLHRLIKALKKRENLLLHVVGGTPSQVESYQEFAKQHGVFDKVEFKGFVPPDDFVNQLRLADAFVSSFDNSERMPYVAHTKIYEYLALGRPVIAPNVEVIQEHAASGILTYDPQDPEALSEAIAIMQDKECLKKYTQQLSQSSILNWKERGELFKKQMTNHLFFKKES